MHKTHTLKKNKKLNTPKTPTKILNHTNTHSNTSRPNQSKDIKTNKLCQKNTSLIDNQNQQTNYLVTTNTKINSNTFTHDRFIMTGQGGNKGATRDLTADPDFIMRDANSPPQGTKRSGGSRTTSTEKNNKLAPKNVTPPSTRFWLGFEMMEKLAMEEGAPLSYTPTSSHNVIKNGFSEKEAKEFLKLVQSYPHVEQMCFPLHRPDGIARQHYNITQLPFEIEIDPDIGLSQDYHIAIYFQKPSHQYTHEEILASTQARLKDMRITLGSKIAEPIAILCRNGSTRHWACTIKLHLKYPGVDGINLLNGIRPFILTLDEVMTVGNICKSYNTIARNNLLSVKINNPSLGNVSGHGLFKEVLEESFKRGQELEITGVQKNVTETWAWLVAPTPAQAEKIVKVKATFRNEIIPTTIKTGERLSLTQLAKKNCLMLVLQGLKLTKTVEETLHEIKDIMGARNVTSSFCPKQRENLHNGSVNIECLNPTVYHQFVNKTHRIHNSHVTFTPHPKNLEGSLPPTEEQQKQFGFCDINSTLVNTIEAIQNAPNNQKMKNKVDNKDINELQLELKTELKKELKDELTSDLKVELAIHREDIIITTNTYAKQLNSNLQEVVRKQMEEFTKIISKTLTGNDENPGLLALPPPPNNPPNM